MTTACEIKKHPACEGTGQWCFTHKVTSHICPCMDTWGTNFGACPGCGGMGRVCVKHPAEQKCNVFQEKK